MGVTGDGMTATGSSRSEPYSSNRPSTVSVGGGGGIDVLLGA